MRARIDVASCAAPGQAASIGRGPSRPTSTSASANVSTGCPLSAFSEPRAGVVAPSWTGGGVQLEAPAGAAFERMRDLAPRLRVRNVPEAAPGCVQGYNADATVDRRPARRCRRRGLFSGGRLRDVGDRDVDVRRRRGPNAARRRRGSVLRRPASATPAVRPPTTRASRSPASPSRLRGDRARGQPARRRAVAARCWPAAGAIADDPLELGATDPVGIRRRARARSTAPKPRRDRPALRRRRAWRRAPRASAAGRPGPGRRRAHGRRMEGDRQRRQRRPRRSPGPHATRNAPALAFAPSRGGRTIVVRRRGPGRRPRFRRHRRRARQDASGRFHAGWRRDGWSHACGAARAAAGPSARLPRTTSGARSAIVGAPVRLRAGFGARLRRCDGRQPHPAADRARAARPPRRPAARRATPSPWSRRSAWTAPSRRSSAVAETRRRRGASAPPCSPRPEPEPAGDQPGHAAGCRPGLREALPAGALALDAAVVAPRGVRGRPRADLRPAAPRRSPAAAVGQAGGAAGLRPRSLAAVRLDAGARAAGPVGHELSLRRRPGHLPHAGADPARRPPAVRARLLAGADRAGGLEADRAGRSRAPSARRRTTRPSRGSRPRGSRARAARRRSRRGGRGHRARRRRRRSPGSAQIRLREIAASAAAVLFSNVLVTVSRPADAISIGTRLGCGVYISARPTSCSRSMRA